MRIAIDTNVLVYAEGFGDASRCATARALLEALPQHQTILPAQCLGELFRVLHGKAGLSSREAAARALEWAGVYTIADSTAEAFLLAFDLARDHAIQMWDALIVAVASKANCTWLATEDVPGEPSLAGVRMANPFADGGLDAFLAGVGVV